MKELLSILKERATEECVADIDENIYNLAKRISKTASEHLKRVMSIMPEYDLHDGSHSEKVAENISMLTGSPVPFPVSRPWLTPSWIASPRMRFGLN